MCREVAVIINLSEDIAGYLNKIKQDGLQIDGAMEARELNSGAYFHGQIQSRVFIIRGEPERECLVFIGSRKEPRYKKSFKIPTNEEYITMRFPD